MSGGLDVLTLNEEDVTKMLAATTHLGSENVHFQVIRIKLSNLFNVYQYVVHDDIRIRSIYLSENVDVIFSQLI